MDTRRALLEWYRPRRGAYPWRVTPDPYRVLVSEVMLQQTRASRVASAYPAFLERFPTVHALAAAPRRDVLRAWDGLGYNRRAIALSGAARVVVREHGGRVPSDLRALQRLPGVGPYTAAAVASLAHGVAAAAVDTNVRRIAARVFLGVGPDDAPPSRIRDLAAGWLDPDDPGAWNQALMDLGREVCRPLPTCGVCPIAGACRFLEEGRVPGPARRRQPAFEGSFRQLRGRIVKALRDRPGASVATLARETGEPFDRVTRAVVALVANGLVEAGPAALAGRPGGRVRLAS
ncbi:MAG: A/G-specific adenine glycosylase [Actinobacteria bacterium]|nr:A/G-specific adenine glycosylase [Actinomycetota bacterium]